MGDFLKKYRSLQFLIIDLLLIIILIIVYYHGNISDKSMSICLLGTYIIGKFILTSLQMYKYPFKCELNICV